jgi:predicted phosphodiesterase
MILQHLNDVIEVRLTDAGIFNLFILSDVHLDSLKCNENLLNKCIKELNSTENSLLLINGDFYDLMQGKYDPRRSYSGLNERYSKDNYIDEVVKHGREIISKIKRPVILGYGNHETNILNRLHTDVLQRTADGFDNVLLSKYEGYILFRRRGYRTFTLYHHHGHGNAPRSKGALKVDLRSVKPADAIVSGHTHQNYYIVKAVDLITDNGHIIKSYIHHIQVPSLKEKDKGMGWAVEKEFDNPVTGYIKMRVALSNHSGEIHNVNVNLVV